MQPGNQQKASLFSFLWFLSFCRIPRLGSLVLDHEQLSGRRCLFFQIRGTFPKPMVVPSLFILYCNYSGARFLAACGGSLIHLQRTWPPPAANTTVIRRRSRKEG